MDQSRYEEDKFALRRRAESVLEGNEVNLHSLTVEDIQNLIHELQVHQVELELQNEQLRQTQRELEAARDKFVYLYDFAPVGYITIDRQGRIWEANLTAVAKLGLERSHLIRHLLSGFIVSEDQETYYLWRCSLFDKQGAQSCEIRLLKRDGSLFYAQLEGLVVEDMAIEESLARVAITDITTRCQADIALAQERNLLRTLIDNLPDYIYVKDRESHFITGNAAVAEVMGAQGVEELVGKTDFDFYPEMFATQFRTDELSVIESGRALLNKEELLVDAEGNERIVSTTKVPLRDQQGNITGLVGIGRDITPRKRIENERAQLFAAISRQREELRALAARLAEVQENERQQLARELHDQMGQNLTALGFNLNYLQTQLARPDPKLPKLQERLADSLSLVEQTTDRIRDVMAELRPPMLDDYGLVDSLEWYAQRFAERMQVEVKVQGDMAPPRLDALIENTFFRITQEALTNVAKHARATQVIISINESAGRICLVIADNGIGFDPSQRNRPVPQPSLGLLTMTERAESLGGLCRIESHPGRGTRITVEVSR